MTTEAAPDSSPPMGSPMHDDPPSSPAKETRSQPSSANPRRLPPPCWSQEETVALIDAYRDKWYFLRRGNLKAPHWQDVADVVSRRCPAASLPKTAVQCRHKMEKLRKRYRAELQRARSLPVARFVSSWAHFKHMDAMEKGPGAPKDPESEEENEDMDDEDDDELFEGIAPNSRSVYGLYGNGVGHETPAAGKSGGGFRIKIPSAVSIAQPGIDHRKFDRSFDRSFGSGPSSGVNASGSNRFARFGGGAGGGYGARVLRESESGKVGLGKRERDPMEEMVGAIRGLGDGFVRMERMKMEMAREMENMRMEMEMKRTEMVLESQQRIVDAFTRAVTEKPARKKKMAKRMPSPENS
ncbi:trihelix transcription factor ASIL2-like [Punica granatum]|uniref:Trihelix transcription factor ASIL2-like n=1 Tax=Punica granatum TaxID=22663 RepID=A0A218VWJ0_PUNGR|nr:trihelix transcription factor ASIL2-like [Punica granatum]OWM64845.1 hypothetical protein CDL15_Pgr028562 [Punica granatum]